MNNQRYCYCGFSTNEKTTYTPLVVVRYIDFVTQSSSLSCVFENGIRHKSVAVGHGSANRRTHQLNVDRGYLK